MTQHKSSPKVDTKSAEVKTISSHARKRYEAPRVIKRGALAKIVAAAVSDDDKGILLV